MRRRTRFQKEKLLQMEEFWRKGKHKIHRPAWVEFSQDDRDDETLKVYINAGYKPADRQRIVGLGAFLDWCQDQGFPFRFDATHKRFIGSAGRPVRYVKFETLTNILCVSIPRGT